MKRIMIDMDNVITDGIIKDLIEDFLGEKVNLDVVKDYTYVQTVTEHRKEEFWEHIKDIDIYGDAPLFDGCYEVLERLNKKYELFIVTSYLWRETIDLSGKNLQYKYYYLKDKLPFLDTKNFIFANNKNIMNFDIKIDDKLENLEGADIKLLFTQWHNKDISDEELEKNNIIRVKNWYEVEKAIENS